MASLLDEVLGQAGGDTAPLLQLPDERPPSLQPDPRVDALGQTFQAIVDYEKRKHQEGVDAGNWEGGWPWEGGHPTWRAAKGGVDAYAQGLLFGTTSPGAPRLSLQRVSSREGVGTKYLDNHTYAIMDPEGYVGALDTTWNPASKELQVNSVAADKGANTLGPSAVRQLRAALLEHYPEAKILLGDRISGAGPGRVAAQSIKREEQ